MEEQIFALIKKFISCDQLYSERELPCFLEWPSWGRLVFMYYFFNNECEDFLLGRHDFSTCRLPYILSLTVRSFWMPSHLFQSSPLVMFCLYSCALLEDCIQVSMIIITNRLGYFQLQSLKLKWNITELCPPDIFVIL